MEGLYNKNSKLDFGMYKGYELGIVFVCDPAYIDWCINNIDSFHITDLNELIEFGVINGELNWQYKAVGDPGIIPNISVFKTYQELIEKVDLDNKKYEFSSATIEKNANKSDDGYENRNRTEDEDHGNNDYEREATYENYNGSYVQDEEGWSDQDINDALDGEPDAYWNID